MDIYFGNERNEEVWRLLEVSLQSEILRLWSFTEILYICQKHWSLWEGGIFYPLPSGSLCCVSGIMQIKALSWEELETFLFLFQLPFMGKLHFPHRERSGVKEVFSLEVSKAQTRKRIPLGRVVVEVIGSPPPHLAYTHSPMSQMPQGKNKCNCPKCQRVWAIMAHELSQKICETLMFLLIRPEYVVTARFARTETKNKDYERHLAERISAHSPASPAHDPPPSFFLHDCGITWHLTQMPAFLLNTSHTGV